MIPALIGLARVYAPYVMFPVALVVGTIGYNVEWSIRDKNNPKGGQRPSVEQERNERRLKQLDEQTDLTQVDSLDSLKAKTFVAKTIFEKNLSPSLKPSSSS